MPRTRIKICGVTSVEVAQAACEAGADAIGLMFYAPSPRHLEIDLAATIRASLPPYVDAVAVVVNPDPDYLHRIVDQVGVSMIQFHGEESNAFCREFGRPFVKALRVADELDLSVAIPAYPDACGILLDTHVKGLYGGSGKTFDWARAQDAGDVPVILAGGLHPDNVAEALAVAAPYAVDVSSGVETGGAKDVLKMQQFCENVLRYSGAG